MAFPLPMLMPQLVNVNLPNLVSIWVNCPKPIGTFKEFFKRISSQELSEEDWQMFPDLLKEIKKEKCPFLPESCSSCLYFEEAIPPLKPLKR